MLSDEQIERLMEMFMELSEKQQEEILNHLRLLYLTKTGRFIEEDDEN